MIKKLLIGSLFAALISCSSPNYDDSIVVPILNTQSYIETNEIFNQGALNQTNGSNSIIYHGGALLNKGINVYFILYGNWSNNTATSILTNFISNIGGTSYFNINTTYFDSSNTRVLNSVIYSGSFYDNYSLGTSLSDTNIQTIVANALISSNLPIDHNGIYFVLTSDDVKETSGFCVNYCGWHTHFTINNTDIKYSFVGNPDLQCPFGCEAQTINSPNDNLGVDAMANIIAHELAEATTDPDLNAWYTRRGMENGDLCAWKFGATSISANGSKYNVVFGTHQYLVQQLWINSGAGYCTLSN